MEWSGVNEWLQLFVRWFHVVMGIMWIGQTYLFNWMERRFSKVATPNVEGELWMVHSGGFFVVQKQREATVLPGQLHWFKWEATLTWLSGVMLLVLIYYAGGVLVDEHVRTLSQPAAVGIGVTLLVLAWFVYDGLWRSPLGEHEVVAGVVCYLLVVAVAFALTQIYSGRGAYMHVGAMFGTLMFTNVWVRILPAQRTMLAAAQSGTKPDMALGRKAAARSKHNTYMSVPVVFVMISNHFPGTYGHDHNWLVLAVLVAVGFGAAKWMRG